ncbi:dual-specificity protein [Lentinula edodes]|uniref:protein-tyrosine-phosphatase n=1 Tax=Lentinula edodes TaxID=5353 RepID=A0A1Q3DYH8_LENED|nr:dual-specificity protein [Lentinula edodes]
MNAMDQVIPGLWIGGLPSAMDTENLKENKIYSVLSAMRGKISIHETFVKHQIFLDDSEEEDILIHLLPAIAFIQSELDKGRGVLVHCQAGVSRSATIVAAYLMHNRQMGVEEALDLIRKARPEIDPNPGFIAQLEIFHHASFNISRKDKDTRLYYMQRTTEEVMNGDGSLPSTDMFARFPRSAIDSAPSTPGGTLRGPRRRIRCKMCRQELAAREHMLDHGQIGPATPVITPAASRRPSTNQPQQPSSRRSSRLGSDSRPRRPSGLSFGGFGDSLTMSSMNGSNTSLTNKTSTSAIVDDDDDEDEEGEPTARPLNDINGRAVTSPPLTATPKGPTGSRPPVPRPFGSASKSIMETMSMSALDSDDEDDEGNNVMSPGTIKLTNIRRPSGSATPSSPNTFAQVATHIGRRMSDAMLTPPVDETHPSAIDTVGHSNGKILEPGSAEKSVKEGDTSPIASPAPNSSPPLARSSSGAPPPLASPNDFAAQLHANPKLAALRGGVSPPLYGTTPLGVDSAASGGGGAKPQPVSPPILMNPKCSGYFVEPMQWMEPFLEAGEIAGKIVCPNKRCGTKLGNYDWAGVRCGCKEWVVPGFCISRSKVDEIVA